MRFGILVFPGSWSHQDFAHVFRRVMGVEAEYVWHKERRLGPFDCLILPGGFAHGDYLRTGAIARFSPIMDAVVDYANRGGLVLGSCNGFQILAESGLLPGALLRNRSLTYACKWVHLRVEETDTPFTSSMEPGQVLKMPISHGEGRYHVDPDTLQEMQANRQIILRYSDAKGFPTDAANPNGSLENIAGVCSRERNVLGLMPHPERAAESILGSVDGLLMFRSILESLACV